VLIWIKSVGICMAATRISHAADAGVDACSLKPDPETASKFPDRYSATRDEARWTAGKLAKLPDLVGKK
jgi:hypothetical protein